MVLIDVKRKLRGIYGGSLKIIDNDNETHPMLNLVREFPQPRPIAVVGNRVLGGTGIDISDVVKPRYLENSKKKDYNRIVLKIA